MQDLDRNRNILLNRVEILSFTLKTRAQSSLAYSPTNPFKDPVPKVAMKARSCLTNHLCFFTYLVNVRCASCSY